MNLEELLQFNLVLFFLILSRWAGMVMLAPVFGARGVPKLVKLGLTVGFSIVVYPLILAASPQIPNELLPFIGVLIKEVLIGLVLGFLINLVTSIMQGAGQLIDFQIGFMMGSTVDPIHGTQSPMTGNFLMVITTMILLSTNAHHYIIAAMVKSYEYIPITPTGVSGGGMYFINITSTVIALSLQIAMPIYGVLFIVNIGVGLLAKTVPQLNMFSVIFPVKIIFGLVLLVLMLPYFGESVSSAFNMTMTWIYELFRGWSQ